MIIEMIKGDDLRVILNVRDTSGDVVDLTGATSIEWAAATNYGATPALTKTLAAGTIVISGPGVIYFDIESTDSGALSVANYKQEMQIVTNGGLTYTVGQGVLRIKPEIIGA